MPTTKPDLEFDSNQVCSGCINFENRKNIDWDKREKEFMKIILFGSPGKKRHTEI